MGAAPVGEKVITFDDFFNKIWEKTIGYAKRIPLIGSFVNVLFSGLKIYLRKWLRQYIENAIGLPDEKFDPKNAKLQLNTYTMCEWVVDEAFKELVEGAATGENLILDFANAVGAEYDTINDIVEEIKNNSDFGLVKLLSDFIESILDDYIKTTTIPGGDVPGMGDDEIDTSGFHWHRPGSFAPQAVTRDESLLAVTAAPASGSSNMMLIFGGVGAFFLLKHLKVI
jgi:hypothetical protein